MTASKTLIVVDISGVIVNDSVFATIKEEVKKKNNKIGEEQFNARLTKLGGLLVAGKYDEGRFWEEALTGTGIPDSPYLRHLARNTMTVLPGVTAALKELSGTGPVWALSNHYGPWLRAGLKAGDVDKYLQRIFVSSETGMMKPGSGCYDYLLKEWNGPPGSVLFIDDTEANLKTARWLGINTYLAETNMDAGAWCRAAKQFRSS